MSLARRIFTRSTLIQQNKRKLLFRYLFYVLLIFIVTGCSLYTVDWNVHISMKAWLKYWNGSSTSANNTDTNIPISLSSSCFKTPYTTQLKHSPALTPGVPLIRLDQCLGFANSISSKNSDYSRQEENVWFHTHWTTTSDHESVETTTQLLSMLRSFSATQPSHAQLMVWVQDQQQETLLLNSQAWHLAKQHMEQKQQIIASGVWTTLMETKESKVQNMDYIGLLILQQYGGVWFHPTILFLRDWSVLIGNREWMIQHDCKATHSGSDSLVDDDESRRRTLMHFFANSTLLCQLIDVATDQGAPTARISFAKVYKSVYRNLIRSGVRPWSILPWCMMNAADGCSSTDTFQLFKKSNGGISTNGVFALQYSVDQWNPNPMSLYGSLDQSHRTIVGW